MNKLFSKRALQQRRRIGDRNGPITMLTPPLKLTLAMGFLIAIAGALWATFARISISVQGTGVLLPISTINAGLSATDGIAFWMFNRPKEPWHQMAKSFMDRPDHFSDQRMALLAERILQESDRSVQFLNKVKKGNSAYTYDYNLQQNYRGQKIDSGTLLMWVQSSSQQEKLSSALDQLNRTILDAKKQSNNIQAQQLILQQEVSRRSAYLRKMKGLEAKSYVTKATILQEEAQVDQLISQIYSNKNMLLQVVNKRDQSFQHLRTELAELINDQLIFARHNVYLSQVIPNNGEAVTKGQTLLELSDDSLDNPVLVPVFLSSKEMAQVFPGMKALATPTGYKRSEVGGIRGNVVSMAKLPSDLAEVTARVGHNSLAKVIINQEPSPTLAVLSLERNTKESIPNSGGYRWSSNGTLPFPPTPADRLNVEITTRRVAPIALVLPALRHFFGVTPPPQSNQTSASKNDQGMQ